MESQENADPAGTSPRESVTITSPAQTDPTQPAPVFISYAHSEFYFVESLNLRLQQLNITTWLDSTQLAPGADWEQSLEEGLASCRALVLVASRAALASSAVRHEWQTALTAGKPIYVAVFEAVTLPPELASANVIDMRSDFENKAEWLADHLRWKWLSDSRRRDPIWRAGWLERRGFPPLTNLSLWMTLGSFWLGALIVAAALTLEEVGAILTLRFVATVNPPAAVLSAFVAIATLALWSYPVFAIISSQLALSRRDWFSLAALGVTDILVLLSALMIAALPIFVANSILPSGMGDSVVSATVFFSIVATLACLVGYYVLGKSVRSLLRRGVVLRWLRTGVAPAGLRVSANRGQILRSTLAAFTGTSAPKREVTYQLLYTPEAESIAKTIRAVLSRQPGLREIINGSAEYSVAILTDRTTRDWLHTALETAPHLVCVVATSLALPVEERAIRRLQWFDYRTRSTEALAALAAHLSGVRAPVKRRDRRIRDEDLPQLPEALERPRKPTDIAMLLSIARACGAFALGAGLFLLVMLSREPSPTYLAGTVLAGTALTLFTGAALFWLTWRLGRWESGGGALLATFALSFVSLALLAIAGIYAAAGLASDVYVFGPFDALLFAPADSGYIAAFLIVVLTPLVILLAILLIRYRAIRAKLPSRALPVRFPWSKPAETQTLAVSSRGFRGYSIFAFLTITTFCLLSAYYFSQDVPLQAQPSGMRVTAVVIAEPDASNGFISSIMLTNYDTITPFIWTLRGDPNLTGIVGPGQSENVTLDVLCTPTPTLYFVDVIHATYAAVSDSQWECLSLGHSPSRNDG